MSHVENAAKFFEGTLLCRKSCLLNWEDTLVGVRAKNGLCRSTMPADICALIAACAAHTLECFSC